MANARYETGAGGAERSAHPIDWRIAELAHRQHGVLSVQQFVALGVGASGVRKRHAAGRLHRVHRGVYAVGRPGLTVEGWYAAGVLACGRGAGLGLTSAAHHRDLLPSPRTKPVHVVVPRQTGRHRRGIAVRRARADLTACDGIPTTTIAQTILDLAATGHIRLAERAIARADAVHEYDFALLHELLERRRGCAGTAAVRALLKHPAHLTRSEYEEAFLAIVRARSLPEPHTNFWIPFPGGGGVEADFAWPAGRVTVEIDSFTFHHTPQAREADTRKDHALERLGWRPPLHFTEHQVTGEPGYVATTLADRLG